MDQEERNTDLTKAKKKVVASVLRGDKIIEIPDLRSRKA